MTTTDTAALHAEWKDLHAQAREIHRTAVARDRRNSPAVIRQLTPIYDRIDTLTAALKADGFDFRTAK
jgi:hypothetical protein